MTVSTCIAVLAAAAAAQAAVPSGEYAPFGACAYSSPGINTCLKSTSSVGSLQFGQATVPLTAATPIVFQGGFGEAPSPSEPSPWFDAVGGYPTLSRTRLVVPGGLSGLLDAKTPLAEAGGRDKTLAALNAVYATPELTGPFRFYFVNMLAHFDDPGMIMPLKVHLENPALGPDCYIGSDARPVVLRLTDGTTHPPAGTEPLSGTLDGLHGVPGTSILDAVMTMVDNTFAAPAARECGASPRSRAMITSALNLINGLPSPAGANSAIMRGAAELAGRIEVGESAQ